MDSGIEEERGRGEGRRARFPEKRQGGLRYWIRLERGHWTHDPWEQGQDNRSGWLNLRKEVSQLREESSSRLLGAPSAARLQTMIPRCLGPRLAPGRRPEPLLGSPNPRALPAADQAQGSLGPVGQTP